MGTILFREPRIRTTWWRQLYVLANENECSLWGEGFPCTAWLQVGSLGRRLSLWGWEPPVSSASSGRIFFFPFSIEWCWRNAILREETGEARDRTQKTIGRGEHKRLCLWVFQILFCVCPRSSPSSDLRVGEDHSFQPVNHPSTFTVSICWVFSVIEALGSHLNTFEPPSS